MILIRTNLANFFHFACVSGTGWLIDLLIYFALIAFLKIDSSLSNFISSYLGITFVWFVSLKLVFKKENYGKDGVCIYWVYQFFSILIYSFLLRWFFYILITIGVDNVDPKLFAKILITPLNLITNFLFMSYLVKVIKNN